MVRAAVLLGAISIVLIPRFLTTQAPELRPGVLRALPITAVDGEVAGYEDNLEPVGRLEVGILRVRLEARAAGWRPWGEDGPMVRAHVFAAEGARAKVPGPLLRVTAGTPMHVTIRNSLGDTLLVRGLLDRGRELPPGVSPGPALVTLPFVGDSLVVAPGETGEVRFTPTVPGSYYYFGRTMEPGWSLTSSPVPLSGWPEAVSFYGESAADRALVGVLIVDAPDEVPDPEERIFLISHWADRDDAGTWVPSARFLVNGRAWPHTERLVYRQGDTVRWRVINQSGGFHPMHLHGFYFHVDAWAGQDGRSPLAPGERPFVVTWGLPPTTVMRLSWVAHEPGNWIFHCHLMRHMSWMQHPVFGGDAADPRHGSGEGVDLMGGLVLGITVEPDEGWTPATDVPRRRLRLHIGLREGVFGDEPGYGFVLQEGLDPPAPDSVRFPGSPIVLNRGEPAEIVVLNHADVPLGVHWHGLELESWADGVPGWSGMRGSIIPAISPADSFVVRMTPPRAGTFMYHVHSEPGHQLAQGLYGPFLVLEHGENWDPETDRLFLLASLGAGENPPPALNGEVEPGPMEFVAGRAYRLRFMHISPDDNKSIQLRAGNEPAEWRVIARDGADLPPSPVEAGPGDVPRFDVGSTFDVLWTPVGPGDMTLRIVTTFDAGLTVFPGDGPPPHTMNIPVRVLPFVAPPASGQAGFPPDSTIQVHLHELVNSHGVTGIVVGLLAEDGTRRVIAHGDPGPRALPLDGNSMFEIGSMTKVFTGILLADMVRRGVVELADPVTELLPPHVSVPARSGKPITLLDLTTHFSGLPMMPTNLAPANPENPFADYTVSQLYESVSTHELQRDPGDVFEYSNLGVALLGHALSLRAGSTYEELVSQRILQPLGMTHTAVTSTPWMEDHLVHGHDRVGNPVSRWDFPTTAGMGGLRSTARDMLTFAAANLAAADPSSVDTGLALAMRDSHRGLRQVGAGVTYPGIPTWTRANGRIFELSGVGSRSPARGRRPHEHRPQQRRLPRLPPSGSNGAHARGAGVGSCSLNRAGVVIRRRREIADENSGEMAGHRDREHRHTARPGRGHALCRELLQARETPRRFPAGGRCDARLVGHSARGTPREDLRLHRVPRPRPRGSDHVQPAIHGSCGRPEPDGGARGLLRPRFREDAAARGAARR
jgi:manganese oxidase